MKIEKMIAGGYGLGRKDGKIYLVKGAYAGEDVEVEVEKQMKDVAFCTVKKIDIPSQKRRIPICSHFGSCGGCDWMDLEYEAQLEYKRDIFTDQMNHIAKVDLLPPQIIPTSQYFYRNKVEFSIKDGKIGYFGKNSHNFVEIDKCHIISNDLNEIKDEAKKHNLNGFDHLVIRKSEGRKMAIFISRTFQKVPDINTDDIVLLVNKNPHVVVAGHQKIIKGNGYLEIELNGITYRIPPKSFFQVNYEGAEILSSKVSEYAGKGENLLDLYCGVGFFTLQVARNFAHVKGVESSPSSVIEARENARLNGLNVDFINSKTSQFELSNFDVVIADPPRSGIDKETMNAILKVRPKKFVYVSCDVSTFARDSYELIQRRYKIKDVVLVDLFPQTHHFEIVSLFEREV